MLSKLRRAKSDLANAFRRRALEQGCHDSRRSIEAALNNVLAKNPNAIPVFLVSYNNGVYVRNITEQLLSYDINPIIMDNKSRDGETLHILNEINQSSRGQVVYCQKNFGHMVGFLHPHYEILPEIFAYSDPDLQFSPRMPTDFLETLSGLTARYKVYKAGLALPVYPEQELTKQTKKRHKTDPFPYHENITVTDWERQHWRFPLINDRYTLYAAPVDTTFAVYRKSNYIGNFFDAVRLSGEDFDAIHLPWFPQLDLLDERRKQAYPAENRATTWFR